MTAGGNWSVTCPGKTPNPSGAHADGPLAGVPELVKSMRWRDVFGGMRRPFAEEKLLHLLHDDFLVLLARGVQAIFVEQHLAVLHPLAPRLLRDIFVDFFSQVAVEWRLGESGQFLFQFCAEDFVIGHRFSFEIIAQASWLSRRAGDRFWPEDVVRCEPVRRQASTRRTKIGAGTKIVVDKLHTNGNILW